MKKIVALVMIIAICISLVACGGQQTPVETTTEPAETTAPAGLQKPEDPQVIATVVTGTEVTQIKTPDELYDAIAESGNSEITLWQDFSQNETIYLPYSCSMDFNGCTLAVWTDFGAGIQVDAAGLENTVTTLKNGTLRQENVGVQVMEGGIVLENMTVSCQTGAALSVYDVDPANRANNLVKNSTLATTGACIQFQLYAENAVEGAKTGVKLENSSLISDRENNGVMFASGGDGTLNCVVELDEASKLYSRSNTLAAEKFLYSGCIYNRSADTASVTAGQDTYDGLYCWSAEQRNDVIDLLMIGNSFCYYYVQELYGIANAAGVEMNVVNLYEAGCNVQEHWTWLSSEAAGKDKYDLWVTNAMGRWKHGDIRTSYETLAYRDWDVISLQQHFKPSVTINYDVAMNTCLPYTDNLFGYLKEQYPDAKLYWHQTWAYQVGHEEIADASVQDRQQQVIIQASAAISSANGVDQIPCGEAWKIARADSRVGDSLCLNDKYHDGDLGGGQYLNACVWFEVLSGKSCIGNTWRPDYKLSEEKIAALQEAAHAAVAAMYGEDYAK